MKDQMPLRFNRSDRRVAFFLLALSLGALTLVYVTGGNDGGDTTPTDSVAATQSVRRPTQQRYAVRDKHTGRFAFDPNTADSTTLLQLGLQPWQVRSIYKYRAAGGVFRRPEDFARLYGLTKKQYEELAPYIRIGDDYRPATDYYAETASPLPADSTPRTDYPHKLKAGEHVELNSADTTTLQRVRGIGSYWAGRIVAYRDRLGGYVSVEQLLEIDEDFPRQALPFFTVQPENIRRMNLNALRLTELKRHPYINYYQAKVIVDYRRLRGPLHSLADLRLSKDFPPEEIRRLEPYVAF